MSNHDIRQPSLPSNLLCKYPNELTKNELTKNLQDG